MPPSDAPGRRHQRLWAQASPIFRQDDGGAFMAVLPFRRGVRLPSPPPYTWGVTTSLTIRSDQPSIIVLFAFRYPRSGKEQTQEPP